MSVLQFPDRQAPTACATLTAGAIRDALKHDRTRRPPRHVEHGSDEMHALIGGALHHHMSADGCSECYGDGVRVLQVFGAAGPGARAALVYEPGALNRFGTAFAYDDHFLVEELAGVSGGAGIPPLR